MILLSDKFTKQTPFKTHLIFHLVWHNYVKIYFPQMITFEDNLGIYQFLNMKTSLYSKLILIPYRTENNPCINYYHRCDKLLIVTWRDSKKIHLKNWLYFIVPMIHLTTSTHRWKYFSTKAPLVYWSNLYEINMIKVSPILPCNCTTVLTICKIEIFL